MRNWLGQEIVPGSVVYRGARDGNSSSFKVGVVRTVDEDKHTARVDWKFQPGGWWHRKDSAGNQERLTSGVSVIQGAGSPAIDSLVLVDVDFGILQEKYDLAREWRDSEMPTAEYKARLNVLNNEF